MLKSLVSVHPVGAVPRNEVVSVLLAGLKQRNAELVDTVLSGRRGLPVPMHDGRLVRLVAEIDEKAFPGVEDDGARATRLM